MSQNEHLRFGKSLDIMNHIIDRKDFLTLKKSELLFMKQTLLKTQKKVHHLSKYQLTVCADDEVTMVFLRESRAK